MFWDIQSCVSQLTLCRVSSIRKFLCGVSDVTVFLAQSLCNSLLV